MPECDGNDNTIAVGDRFRITALDPNVSTSVTVSITTAAADKIDGVDTIALESPNASVDIICYDKSNGAGKYAIL